MSFSSPVHFSEVQPGKCAHSGAGIPVSPQLTNCVEWIPLGGSVSILRLAVGPLPVFDTCVASLRSSIRARATLCRDPYRNECFLKQWICIEHRI